MLFDLRGRGRRRTVQVIYVCLALLLGGGLVFFGIGGDVQGGLFDAFSENRGSGAEQIEDDAKDARENAQKTPAEARVWAVLAEKEFQLAGVSDGFNEEAGTFEGESRERLVEAERAWDRHLKLAEEQNAKPNITAAGVMRLAFSPTALNKPDKTVRIEEILLETKPKPGSGDYASLAQAAFLAGQTRKGDLAMKKALSLEKDKDRRDQLKAALEGVKAQAATQSAQNATGGTPSPPAGE